MRLNSEIEALKSFFLEQIFIVKKSLEEKQLRPRWISEGGNQITQSRKPNEDCHQLQRNEDSSTTIKTAMKDGKTITEDLPIAEIFNNYFSNVIRSLCDRHVPTEPGIACSQNTVSTVINKFRNHPSILSIKKTWRQ